MLRKSVLFLPLLLSGCMAPVAMGLGALGMTAAEDRGVGGAASDQSLRVKLNFQLSNKLTNFEGIELTVYKGRVLFTGVAANEQVKADTIRIAKGVAGVKQVVDGMIVHGEDGFAEYTRDAWMTTKLKAALYGDQDVIAPNYLIRTFDKTIYVFGTAQTQTEMQKVIDHANEISGVKKVVNLIEIQGAQKSNKKH